MVDLMYDCCYSKLIIAVTIWLGSSSSSEGVMSTCQDQVETDCGGSQLIKYSEKGGSEAFVFARF
jgi:hypothetical protein